MKSILLLLALPLSLVALYEVDIPQFRENSEKSYVYCDETHTKMTELIAQISELDENKNSPVWKLNQYINNGFSIGEEAIIEALIYAEEFVNRNLSNEQIAQLQAILNSVIDEIMNNELSIDIQCIFDSPNYRNQCCNQENGQAIIKVRNKLYVLQSAKFFKDVEIDGKLKIYGKTVFKNNVKFKDDVVFEDDVLIEGDLTVDGTTTFNGPIAGLTIIDDLSATDAVIQNLSVTDLVVLSCMDSLCVNSLSVVDEVVTGTLSVNDLALGTLDVDCDLTVGCNIIMNDSISPSVGNIIKNGNPFIHNFGTNNTFMGVSAGNFTTTGQVNTALGIGALTSNTLGNYNTSTGGGSLSANTAGSGNVANGVAALVANVSGSFNTAIGFTSLLVHTSGDFNTAVGVLSLGSNTTGSRNTAIGQGTFEGTLSGSDNVALGSGAGNNLLNGDNNIYIANSGIPAENSAIRIGTLGTHTTAFMQGISGATTALAAIPVLVDANGQLGTISSSATRKHNIKDMKEASALIYKLRPVTFAFNNDATETEQYGLIAEEVAVVFPELVARDQNGKPYAVHYETLPALLLNELQKQHACIEALIERVAHLEKASAA